MQRHILVVDSNPRDLNHRLELLGGEALGDGFAGVLWALDAGVMTTVVGPYDGETAADLSRYDGVVFTGSSVSWNTDDEQAAPLAAVMQEAFGHGLPVFGSCNGMQLAASVLGGSSDASPNGREDGLARDIRLTGAGAAHPMLAGRADGYAALCTHRDEVRRVPDGATVLAGNGHSAVQAFVHERDGVRFWGTQYHPEFSPRFLAAYLESLGRVDERTVADLASAETDADAAARLGTTRAEMAFGQRSMELDNWLKSIKGS